MAVEPRDPGSPTPLWQSPAAAAAWQANAAVRAQTIGPATERMLELAGVRAGSRVLDLAAGTGDQTIMAARRVGPTGSVMAVDVSADMLALAARAAREAGLTNVQTRVMDVQHLDFPAASFDAVISRNGLQFMPDLAQTLVGIRRVLEPGGALAAIVFSAAERNPLTSRSRAIIQQRTGVPSGLSVQFALGAPGAFEQALRAAGFREVAVHVVPAPRQFTSMAAALDAVRQNLNPNSPDTQALVKLSSADQTEVWAEIEQAFRPFEGPNGVDFPGELLLGTGTS